jgi:proline iminopeptidase
VPSLTTSDGRMLAWREVGSGPPLVLHSGGPGFSSAYFAEQPELAAERTLVILDPRGTGGSDRPAEPGGYDLEQYAADIEALREAVGLERLDLLGHSHGGFVAMTWAGTHPDRVGRLVLASTAPRFTDALRARRAERVASHQGRPYFEDAVAALADQQAGNYADDEELAALYARAGRVLAPVGADLEAVAEVYRAGGMNSDALRHFNHRIAPGMDLRPLLERIEAPALVIAGERDGFEVASAEIARHLPNPTVVTIPVGDHFIFLEAASRPAWAREILSFLGEA